MNDHDSNDHDSIDQSIESSDTPKHPDPNPAPVTKKRRPFQIRLRTMLFLMAIVGVAAGVWGSRLYREHCATAAVEYVTAAGARAIKNKDGEVYRVHLTGEKFNDQALAKMAPHLYYLPKMRQLDLVKVPISDEGLQHLGRLGQLRDLYVFETKVTPAGTAALQKILPELVVKNEHPTPFASSMAGASIYRHAINVIAMRSDGKQFVAGNGAGELRWWDNYQDSPRTRITPAHTDWLFGAAYSVDGTRLATGGGDGLIRIWDTRSHHPRQPLAEMDVHDDDVHAVAFAPDGASLFSVSDDMTVRRTWLKTSPANADDVENAGKNAGQAARSDNSDERRSIVLGRHAATIPGMALAPSGNIVASASRDDTIVLWDAEGGGLLRSLVGHSDDVMSVAFSADGKTLVSCSYDKTVRVWDVATGESLGILSGHKGRVYSVAISPDGTTIASGGVDGLIVWERDLQQASRRFVHQKNVSCLRFASDNELAVADTSGRVRVIDLKTGKSRQSFSTSRAAMPIR